jgi:hypothetical protein
MPFRFGWIAAALKNVSFSGRPSGYRWNRESTALPLQCCHLFKQIAEKPSEESVFGNPNYPSRKGADYYSQPLFEFIRCISATVNLNVQTCPEGWDGQDNHQWSRSVDKNCTSRRVCHEAALWVAIRVTRDPSPMPTSVAYCDSIALMALF